MANIKSNTGTANLIATSIARSLDGLSTGGVITSDTQTTISGNTTAAEAIQAMSDATNSVLQAVGQASINLQSIAADFEAMDQATRAIFTSPLPTFSGGSSQ
jgi:type VII secretion effector (TIGR04197 family)